MYGSINPALRHFGADELAAQATLQGLNERRLRGEPVSPAEESLARSGPPQYDEYFEFVRPVPSGLGPDTRDLLVEEALGMAGAPAAQQRQGVSNARTRPAAHTPDAQPYDPPPDATLTPRGDASDAPTGGGASSRRGGDGERYPWLRPAGERRTYGDYRGEAARESRGSPRSSPNASPPRSPTIGQPPFYAGMPIARRPNKTKREAGGAAPSPRDASPEQDLQVRGVGARSSGRPASAGASTAGGSGRSPRRRPASAVAASPRAATPASPSARAARTPVRASGKPPAWAPTAAGSQGTRLDDMDEAQRVALMLNDPSANQRQRPGHETAGADGSRPVGPPAPHPSASPRPQRSQELGSGRRPDSPGSRRTGEAADAFYSAYRLRKHREAQGVPDYRFSQPRSQGAHAPVPQHYFSFDEAHPALAEQHFVRSPTQESMLQAERRKMHAARARAERASARGRSSPASASPSPSPSALQLAADVGRMARVRDAGRQRLKQLEEEGEALRAETRQVTQRALSAIARAEHATAVARNRASRSPSASPTPRRSRSPSPSAYYGGGAYGGGRDLSPHSSRTPLGGYRRRPSASPEVGYGYAYDDAAAAAVYDNVDQHYDEDGSDEYASGGSYYDSGAPSSAAYAGAYDARADAARQADQGRRAAAAAPPAPPQYASYAPHAPAASPPPAVSSPPPPYYPPQQHPHPGAPGSGPHAARAGARASPPPGPQDAAAMLHAIQAVERLPQHEQVPQDAQPPPDPLQRAAAALRGRGLGGGSGGGAVGPLMGGGEAAVALGAYDPSRYAEYSRQVDAEMLRRALEGGYDSDQDREAAAATLVAQPEEDERDKEEARRRELQATWAHQNQWMDDYRRDLGPEEGYLSPPDYDYEPAGPSSAAGAAAAVRSALSEHEEALVEGQYVPNVYGELTEILGYASEGPDAAASHHHAPRRRLFHRTTVPQPFEFEERSRTRPKPIMQVKLEQDLALKAAEAAAASTYRFRASPMPAAAAEPRYERMLLEGEVRREMRRQQREEELLSMVERPYSALYERQQRRRAEREELARAAKDPNRFQAAFRARDVPAYVKQERFRSMMAALESRRDTTRRRVEDARRAARERAEEAARERQAAATRAYTERLRAVDAGLHPSPYAPKPPGALPDFNALHAAHEVAAARTRAHVRKRVTVPREFRLNGASPTEQEARARKAQERRQRIILDMQVDAELLPETRWPYRSPRGKVHRVPPPAYLVEYMARASPNKSASARKSAHAAAAGDGKYLLRSEREEVERIRSEKLRAEALRRADRILADAAKRRAAEAEKAAAARAGGNAGGGGGGLASDAGATAKGGADVASEDSRAAAVRRREEAAGRHDAPEVYVEARHAQIERRVREVVEDTLLDAGIEGYRYVEGVGAGRGRGGAGRNQAEGSPS